MNKHDVDLSVVLGRIKLKNPIMPASGTFGYGEEFSHFLDLRELGAIVVKSISLKPKLGSFQHRSIEIAGCCFLTTVGLQNVGAQCFVEDKLPYLRQFGTPIIVNIACVTIDEFVAVTDFLSRAEGVDGIELNLSCPNVGEGGKSFASNPVTTFNVIKAVKDTTDLTVIGKVPIIGGDIINLAKSCENAGADALRLGIGLSGMAIDINSRRSVLGENMTAGLLGPWLKPAGVRAVWEVARVVSIPIIGGGGITCAEDALEFLIAGASAIQIGTYNLIDPTVMAKTIEGIREYLIVKGIRDIREIIGSLVMS